MGQTRRCLARENESRLSAYRSKYPPAKPGALLCEPLKAAYAGTLTRPRLRRATLTGGRSLPEVELVQSFVFLFLVADVLADHGFIPAYRGHHVPSRPEVLTNEILLALSIDPGKMNRTLALDVSHYL